MTNPHLHDLAWGPSRKAKSWTTFFVSGFKFQTSAWSQHRKTINSGVWVRGDQGESREDDYFGIIEDIVELEYSGETTKTVVLFYCKWFDPQRRRGTKVHPQYGLVEVKHRRQLDYFDPFIIAQTARQAYYTVFPLTSSKSAWWAAIKTKPVGRVEIEDSINTAFQNESSNMDYLVDDQLEDNLLDEDGDVEEIDSSLVNNIIRHRNQDFIDNDEAEEEEEEESSNENESEDQSDDSE